MKKLKAIIAVACGVLLTLVGGVTAQVKSETSSTIAVNNTLSAPDAINDKVYEVGTDAILNTNWKDAFSASQLDAVQHIKFVDSSFSLPATATLLTYDNNTISLEGNIEVRFDSADNTMYIFASNGGQVYSPTSLSKMFYLTNLLTIDFGMNFNVSNATSFWRIFTDTDAPVALTHIYGMEHFNTENVTVLTSLFRYMTNLEYADVSNFNTSNVSQMASAFAHTYNLSVIDVSNWDVSNVTEMSQIFYHARSVATLDVSNWNVSKVKNFDYAFSDVHSLLNLDLKNWVTSSAVNMGTMFCRMNNVTSLDLSNFDTSNVTTMRGMFYDNAQLTSIVGLDDFDTSNVITMSEMFYRVGVTSLDLGNWDTSSVENMFRMFIYSSKISDLNLTNWNTTNVKTMESMFYNLTSLKTLNISNFNTENVINMRKMFELSGLQYLDMSNFVINDGVDTSEMFNRMASSMKVIQLPKTVGETISVNLPTNSNLLSLEAGYPVVTQITNATQGKIVSDNMLTNVVNIKSEVGGYNVFTNYSNNKTITLPSADVITFSNNNLIIGGLSLNADATSSSFLFGSEYTMAANSQIDNLHIVWVAPTFTFVWENPNNDDNYLVVNGEKTPNATYPDLSLDDTLVLESKLGGGATGSFTGFRVKFGNEWHFIGKGELVSEYNVLDLSTIIDQNFIGTYISGGQIVFEAVYGSVAFTITSSTVAENGDIAISGLDLSNSNPLTYLQGSTLNYVITPHKYYVIDQIIINSVVVYDNASQAKGSYTFSRELTENIDIEVRYIKLEYVININAVDINGNEINDIILVEMLSSTVLAGDLVTGISAITSENAYVFKRFEYSDGTYITSNSNLNEIILNETKSNGSIFNVNVVFELRYSLNINNIDSANAYSVNYTNKMQEVVTEENVAQVWVYENSPVTIYLTPKHGYALDLDNSALTESEKNAYIQSGNIVLLINNNRDLELVFEPQSFNIVVVNVDNEGEKINSLALVNNYVLSNTSADLNSSFDFSVLVSSVDSAKYRFDGAYLGTAQQYFELLSKNNTNINYTISTETLKYAVSASGSNQLTINIVWVPQSILNINLVNYESKMGSTQVSFVDHNGNTVVTNDTKVQVDLNQDIEFKVLVNPHYMVNSFYGANATLTNNTVNFKILGEVKELTLEIAPIKYNVSLTGTSVPYGEVSTELIEVYIGQEITLHFDSSTAHEVSSWNVENVNAVRKGNSVTFEVTSEFLNSSINDQGVVVIENSIETIMNAGVLGGIIGGSVGFVALAILVALLVLRNKKQKAEQAAIQAKLDAVSKKFNISDVIKDLKGKK